MRRYEGQQPCPSCGEPMSGLSWRCEDHECEFYLTQPLKCSLQHSEFWMGPWGHCRKCSSEQIALAVEERIARELERLADSYIPVGEFVSASDSIDDTLDKVLGVPGSGGMTDIWTWTGKLAERIRAGEFTQPLDKEPPF